LSFGIDAVVHFVREDFTKGNFFENQGENLNGENAKVKFYPSCFGAGAFLYSDNWYLGASVPRFF